MSQNDPKTNSLMTSLTKNRQPSTKKFFLEYRLEDWPIHLRIWAVLKRNSWRSYGVGKATENCWFWTKMKVRIYHTPALSVSSQIPTFTSNWGWPQ